MKKQILSLALAVVGFAFGAVTQAHAESLVGTNTSNQIFTFDSATPGTTTIPTNISGLIAGDVIRGIDRRPANGLVYAVAQGVLADRIYTIDPGTGVATLVSTLSVRLSGTSFGVDFNPVVDRLRITSNADQNLRVEVVSGTAIVDGTLAYAPGDTNAGRNPNVVGSAYSNNFAGTSTTVLRDIDANNPNSLLAIQNPPNNGTLNTALILNAGGNVNSDFVSYDISGLTGTPYVVFSFVGEQFSRLFTISAAGLSGGLRIGSDSLSVGIVTGLAAPVGAPVPEPATMILLGTGLAGLAAARRKRKATE